MIDALQAAMSRLERALRLVAAACLLAVMTIVFTDVGARYLANSPLSWSYDLIGMYLMPVLFYFALSDTLAAQHHVAVDLLRSRMAPSLIRWIELLGSAAMAVVFAMIGTIYLTSGWVKYETNALVLSVGQWPAWIPDAIVVVGAFSITMRLVGRTAGHALSLWTGKPLINLPTAAES